MLLKSICSDPLFNKNWYWIEFILHEVSHLKTSSCYLNKICVIKENESMNDSASLIFQQIKVKNCNCEDQNLPHYEFNLHIASMFHLLGIASAVRL